MSRIHSCMVFAVLTVLFASLPTGNAFRCWFCNAETDPKCNDPFNTTSSQRHEDCNPYYNPNSVNNRYVCRKVKYHRLDKYEPVVDRDCVEETTACSVEKLSKFLRAEHCSTCDTDLCNSAPALFKAASLAPVAVFLYKMNNW